MNTITTPAPARTDTRPAPHDGHPPDPSVRLLSTAGVRAAGIAVTALALAHAVIFLSFTGDWTTTGRFMLALAGYALQLSMLGVLLVMWRTRAVGDGIGWRLTGAIVTVLTLAAIACGVMYQLMPDSAAAKTLANVFQLAALAGLYALSIGVVSQRRWRGIVRFMPILGSSWGPAVVIATMLGDGDTSWLIFVIYLSASAILNGLVLAVRPDLTQLQVTR